MMPPSSSARSSRKHPRDSLLLDVDGVLAPDFRAIVLCQQVWKRLLERLGDRLHTIARWKRESLSRRFYKEFDERDGQTLRQSLHDIDRGIPY